MTDSISRVADELSLFLLSLPFDEPDVVGFIKRLRAIAASEPVGWAYVNDDGECEECAWGLAPDNEPPYTLLYAAPQPSRTAELVAELQEFVANLRSSHEFIDLDEDVLADELSANAKQSIKP